MPKSLEIQISGESLFNDSIGVVVFIVLHEIVIRGEQPSLAISTVFFEEAVGAAIVGLALKVG